MNPAKYTLLIIQLILFCCLAATQGEALGYPSRSEDLDALPGFNELPPGYGQVPFWSEMIDSTKLTGGLVVHVGGSESEMAALSSIKGFVIHGLHRSPEMVDATRDAIQSSGYYGKISVEIYDGKHLPYADNIVNLLFASEPESQLNEAEILRVLVPGGKASVNGKTIKKAIPNDIDEWPQYLHDSGNNAVAEDMGGNDHQYQLFECRILKPKGPNPPVSEFQTTKEKRDVWNVTVKMRPRAMVKAGGHVFLLGVPEKGTDLKGSTGIIRSFLTGSGEPALTFKLPAVPVWDGVAVSQGRMFISLEDGSLHCLGN
jgi:hypothetical protein